MAKLPPDQAVSDFFGEDVAISSSSYPAGRVAIARDNARLFVGNVNNYYTENPKRDAFSIEDLSITDTTMMDPLSFTISVLAAVSQTADTLRSCQRHAAGLRMADLSIASLHTECSTIRLRLNQIQSLILRGGENKLEDRFEAYVLNEYDDLLQACCLPFSLLNRHLASLGITQMKEMDRITLRGKLHDIWAYSQMEMICHTIGSLARAIGILSSAFQSDTATKASEIMRSPESKMVLASLSDDAVSLHNSFLATCGTQEESIRNSVIGDEFFDFEHVLKSTELYRKAFVRQMLRPQATKSEISINAATTNPSVPEDPVEPPVPIDSGLTFTSTNSPSSPEGPGDSSLGKRGPKVETKMKPAALDRKLTLVPIQRTYGIPILPYLTLQHTSKRFGRVGTVQDERRNSIHFQTSDDTILPDDSLSKSSPVEDIFAGNSALLKGSRLPVLSEVLGRRTVKPYSLFEFCLYMRDIEQSVNYLDFWLEVERHLFLWRHHVQILRRDLLVSDGAPSMIDDGNDAKEFNMGNYKIFARSEIRASAWAIFQTFVNPGSERGIVIPGAVLQSITYQIEEEGRNDPKVFDGAKHYVYQLMAQEAFPRFLNLGLDVFRTSRKSKSLGGLPGLVQKMALRRRD